MGDDDPPGRGQFRPQGHDWQDLCRYHLTLLHTKYTSFRPCGFREEDFKMFSHYKIIILKAQGLPQ